MGAAIQVVEYEYVDTCRVHGRPTPHLDGACLLCGPGESWGQAWERAERESQATAKVQAVRGSLLSAQNRLRRKAVNARFVLMAALLAFWVAVIGTAVFNPHRFVTVLLQSLLWLGVAYFVSAWIAES